ncbi:cyclic-amp phosphodiesterase, class-II [Naegleria gruberi]|uniref:Cyclic-amp phosphodiesterase, class-II n=1 Tax=Naegleria gruberi TaxID=5762 RepID=D2VQ72_NAEGR|nr:cyclic-amp phosphodiesterase, class-II [Naegleria gruberi]EFC41057.1 cyclic-amp phosphodiesterase, class-II [Naegleria gruberi]|eukprot:XP_002673801.1 cyclic-amp phosphodiesterase, class-II [Naegleria gruberi strain NEG-M]
MEAAAAAGASEDEIKSTLNDKCTFGLVISGREGGLLESDLTNVLLRTNSSRGNFISLDAGILLSGIYKFVSSETNNQTFIKLLFPNLPSWLSSVDMSSLKTTSEKNQYYLSLSGYIMKQFILGYFIGHAHLDHLSGLVISSPEGTFMDTSTKDYQIPSSKRIITSTEVISAINSSLFNDKVWPDIPKYTPWYQYQPIEHNINYYVNDLIYMSPNSFNPKIDTHQLIGSNYLFSDTTVKSFSLCHSLPSAAFLFEHDNVQLIFFSDTGSNTYSSCDWRSKITAVWNAVDISKLRVIIIEVSFTNEAQDSELYGHMRPKDLVLILKELSNLKGDKLSSLTIVVTHIKPTFTSTFSESAQVLIQKQLQSGLKEASLDCAVTIPEQGQFLCFY